MPSDQILMGVGVAVMSAVGFWKTDWLLRHTPKGEWFVRRYGVGRARLIVRTCFFFAAVFGVLLAVNVIRPVQW